MSKNNSANEELISLPIVGSDSHTDELRRYNSALLQITRARISDFKSLEETLQFITEVAAQSIQVDRCSVWLYTSDKSAIECLDLYQVSKSEHSKGTLLYAKDFPNYFNYLTESRVLAAHDAITDSATAEFAQIYLAPLGITSMLDAPIRINGEVIGVVCSEHVGPKRKWSIEEEIFGGVISDYVGRVIETFQHKEMEAAVERERLLALSNAKLAALGEMAGGIAHEINSPLQVILSRAEALIEGLNNGPVEPAFLKVNLESIVRTSQRISKIVRGLKLISRDGSSDSFQELNLLELVDDTLTYFKEKMRQRGVEVIYQPPNQDIMASCNAVGISQVLVNLLNNACDAVEELPRKWVRLDIQESDKDITFRVIDSGSGIPQEIRPKLMQAHFTTKPVGKGTGLGLSLSNNIMLMHGGSLSLDTNQPNTTFVAVIPKNAKLKKSAA